MRNDLFTVLVLLSVSLHGGAAWYFHSTYQPPVALETRRGLVSIDLQASIAAQPKDDAPAPKPPEKLPPPMPVPPEKVDAPEVLPAPQKVAEVVKPKAIESPKASAPSPGSKASEGTKFDEWPQTVDTNPVPPYPAADWLAGHQGTVTLFVRIDATGKVTFARVHVSSGYPGLDQSALATIAVWRFRPARQSGTAVASEVLKPFAFSILR